MTTQINSNWRTVAIMYYTITLPPNKREGEEMNTSSLCITMDQKFNGLENEMAKGNDKATPLQKKGNNMAGRDGCFGKKMVYYKPGRSR